MFDQQLGVKNNNDIQMTLMSSINCYKGIIVMLACLCRFVNAF